MPIEVHFVDDLKLPPLKVTHQMCMEAQGNNKSHKVATDSDRMIDVCFTQPELRDRARQQPVVVYQKAKTLKPG